MQSVYPLKGVVQHYAWGGAEFIPELLKISNPEKQPFGELWLGTHQKGPAIITSGDEKATLTDLISSSPENCLNEQVVKYFGNQLPYLLKILDVKKMLSIQVHPNKKAAEKGFAAEEASGPARDAFNRNFRDDNHKPELMWALTDFWLLHGFRSKEAITEILNNIPEFASLKSVFEPDQDIAALYQYVMELPQVEVNEMLEPLKQRLEVAEREGKLDKHHPDFWANRAFKDFTTEEGYDRGMFSVYFLNLVYLKKGEAIFQDSGILHAYLEGANVELMANSDNVLRGGLTPKYVDVPELMKHVHFKSIVPNISKPMPLSPVRSVVKTPAPDFELSCIELSDDQFYSRQQGNGPEIYIVMEGKITVDGTHEFSKGESFFVPDVAEIKVSGNGIVFCAGVPMG